LELNPGDVQVRQHYAHYLLGMRRPVDARVQIQHALALDPLSAMLIVDVGHTYGYAGQFPEAIKLGRQALGMDNNFLYARMMLGWSYWHSGRVEEALGVGWPNPFQPEINHRAKEIYEQAGRDAMLRWLVKNYEQRNATGEFYSRSSQVAFWYAILGDREKSIDWLNRSFEEHDPWLPIDLAETQFDELRSDPRFQDLLRRIGLPHTH
jgi:tetratricopeptide (TPR) repeat protein